MAEGLLCFECFTPLSIRCWPQEERRSRRSTEGITLLIYPPSLCWFLFNKEWGLICWKLCRVCSSVEDLRFRWEQSKQLGDFTMVSKQNTFCTLLTKCLSLFWVGMAEDAWEYWTCAHSWNYCLWIGNLFFLTAKN